MSDLSQLHCLESHHFHRSLTVPLSMSGPESRWIAAVGDWSWDFVNRHCGVNVFHARNSEGKPSYLAFCYIRMLGSHSFPCNAIPLGAELDLTSTGFRGSSESLSVVHQIRRKDAPFTSRPSYDDLLSAPDESSLHIETFNRWLVRSQEHDNADLSRSAPPEFRNEHLPPIPDALHPWRRYRPALDRLSFHCDDDPWEEAAPPAAQPYLVDPDRDLNGVSLLYFATYFDLFQVGARDAAIRAGLSPVMFRQRAVLEQEVVYAGNANAGEQLEILSRARRHGASGATLIDVVVKRVTGEIVAVSTERSEPAEAGRSRGGAAPKVVAINGNGVARTAPYTAPPEDLRGKLLGFVERLISETIANPNGALPIDRSFGELGLDSCARVDVLSRLESFFGPVDLGAPFLRNTIETLSAGLLRQKEGAVRRLLARQAPSSAPGAPVLEPDAANRFQPFPATAIQRAYLAGRSDAFPLGGQGCHLYWEFESRDWDPARLEHAWQALVRRHDMLRATFSPDGRQCVAAEVPEYAIAVHEFADEADVAAIRDRISHTNFAPGQWPLFCVELSRFGDSMRLHFAIDMLVADGPSLFLLMTEWSELYEDPERELPPIRVSFRDYVLHQGTLQASESYSAAQAYWSSRALPPAPELSAAGDLTALRNLRFRRLSSRLGADAWSVLQRRARDAGLTSAAVLLTAFAESLRLWLRRPEFTINVTTANRLPAHPEMGRVAGDFTSNVLVAVDCSAGETFASRAGRVQDALEEALNHSLVSGVEALAQRSRERGESVLMPVVFTSFLGYSGILKRLTNWTGLGTFVEGLTETPQVWLDCQVLEDRDDLCLSWDVADGVLPAGLADEMFAAFHGFVEGLCRDERTWQSDRRQLLPARSLEARRAANATAKAFGPALIHSAFREQARCFPDWTAVIDPRRELTYGELDRLAGRIAAELRAAGAERNQLVAVVMEKGWEEVAAVVGIVMSGAAYLPIDAGLPPHRIRQLLELGEARIVLTQIAVEARFEWPDGLTRIAVDAIDIPSETTEEHAPSDPSDLAYVIFTSGSTGVPKGVMIDHRGAVNTIRDINERFGVGARDRAIALSSLNFDLSVYDIFGVLGAGGAVVIPDGGSIRDPLYLLDLARRERVTIWNSVPSFLHMLVEAAGDSAPLPEMRLVMLSGDWIPVQLPDRIRALCPKARTVSLGGATEGSIWSIAFPIGRVDPAWKSIPYGKPLANQSFHVLNNCLEDCPTGVPGELYIGGVGVALGYWRDEARTRASFLAHPDTGERLYRTGDWGAYLPDGNIEFLGRADLQVKIGGHRVELGEVEAALATCPEVAAALAVTFTDEHREKRLAACLIAKDDASIDPQAIRTALASRLPAYMVPAHVVCLRSFPLTPNGKVDRKALEGLAMHRAAAPDGSQDGAIPLGDCPSEQEIAAHERRRSSRVFFPAPVTRAQLAGLLGLLRGIDVGGRRKYRYPSAGGVYPMRTYLHMKPGGSSDLDPGLYSYDAFGHSLRRVSDFPEFPADLHAPVNRQPSADAAFSIFLIADLRAIQSVYGDLASDFVKLEAGYMGQLLMDGAPDHALALCPIGYLAFEKISEHFRLSEDQVLVHSFLGGSDGPPPSAAAPIPAAVVEDQIASIWSEVLRRPHIDRDQNFFEAGGTSFAAIEAHRRIVAMGIACTITDLFRHPTVRSLAARLEGAAEPVQAPVAAPVDDSRVSRRDRRRAVRSTSGDPR
jgi:epothilone synthetase B